VCIPSSLNFLDWCISDISKNEFEYLNDYSYKDSVIKTLKNNLLSALELPICAFTEIKNDIFINAERGSAEYKDNFQTLDAFLSKYHFIHRGK
jgi:hypothetical protein